MSDSPYPGQARVRARRYVAFGPVFAPACPIHQLIKTRMMVKYAPFLSALALSALLWTAAVPSSNGQPAPTSRSDLQTEIDRILDADEFSNAFWGLHVVDLAGGETLYSRNPGKSFVPASNTKLYTTAAALDRLGWMYRYRTRLYVDGPVENGVLRGNLIVRGAADPTIGTHYEAGEGEWEAEVDATRLFRDWADSLRAAGITRIDGDIVGDDDVIDDVPLGNNWSWDDETFYYSAQISGLTFNDNVIHLHVTSRRRGRPADLRWYPYDTDYVEVVNRSLTIHPDSSRDEGYLRRRGTNAIEVTTEIPEGDEDVEEITVENPTAFFVHVLAETLRREGIAVSGTPVDVDDLSIKPDYTSPNVRRVAYHESPTLAEIVSIINKPSQNLFAELVLKTLGAEFPVQDEDLEPGSAAMGVAASMETFARARIDTSRIRLVDGSGLSRLNLVTPEMTTRLLTYMWSHEDTPVRRAFIESLPLAGRQGTLRNRLRRGPAEGNLRAKTGTLSSVSSLSGYVNVDGNRPLVFAMMSNHYTTRTREVREAQDAVVKLLSQYRQ